jgi:hypothetical protein
VTTPTKAPVNKGGVDATEMQPRNRSHRHGLVATLPLALLLAACGAGASPSAASHSTPTPTPIPTPVSTPSAVPSTPPTPSPTPSAPVVANPLAVVASPNGFSGPYTLGLVNAKGIVVATVTAKNPSDYWVGGDPTITSTSDTRLYYEDGNTNIDYLTPTGQHGVAFTVNRPTGAEVVFAVSPDDSRVAVAVLTNFNGEAPPYTSHMYLMAMGGGIQQTLFDGTSTSSTAPLTWPVGWDGANLVVAQSLPDYFSGLEPGTGPCSGGWGGSPSSAVFCASQLRVFNPVDRTFGPPLCPLDTEVMDGSPTAAGIACSGTGKPWEVTTPELTAVSWSGVITSFGSNIPGGCMLSPHGAVIACPSEIDNPGTGYQQNLPAHLFRAGGVVQKIPNPYNAQIMGWLDGDDVVVTTSVDSTGLAVENIVTGKQIPVSMAKSPIPFAVPWQYFGVIPGAL